MATKPTVLGLDLQGGVQLVYRAEPTAQQAVDADSMQRSIDLMQQRVNEFGVAEAELFQSGEDQIEVNLPGVKDAEDAARQVGSTAQLFFYDWEANLLDDKCKTNAELNANQRQPINGIYKAVTAGVEVHRRRRRQGLGPAGARLARRRVRGRRQAALLRLRQDQEGAVRRRRRRCRRSARARTRWTR